jgi:hypothetical protein
LKIGLVIGPLNQIAGLKQQNATGEIKKQKPPNKAHGGGNKRRRFRRGLCQASSSNLFTISLNAFRCGRALRLFFLCFFPATLRDLEIRLLYQASKSLTKALASSEVPAFHVL